MTSEYIFSTIFSQFEAFGKISQTSYWSEKNFNLWTTRKLINSGDRMSMAHSLEARVPFFDVDYISTAMAVNPAKKLIRKVSS